MRPQEALTTGDRRQRSPLPESFYCRAEGGALPGSDASGTVLHIPPAHRETKERRDAA